MRLVLADARLHGHDEALDIVIEDGIIVDIVPEGSGAGDVRRSLDGRLVIPGLWDNHVHFTQWALASRRLDLSGAESAGDAAELVLHRLAAGAGEVVARGFRDALWPDEPTSAVLDAVSGTIPVVAVSADLHSAWLNSAALRTYGFADHPTGLLREEDAFALVRELGNVSDDLVDTWAIEAAHAAAARGVVGIVDLEMTWNLDVWKRRMARGMDCLRVEFGIYRAELARAIDLGLRSGAGVDGTDGLLSVGPFKVITDGSLNTRTAYCFDGYPDETGAEDVNGVLTIPPDELVPLLEQATAAGLRVAVHAIGDRANTLALDAIESSGARGSIEHAQLLTSADVQRFAEFGVIASVQPEHAMDDRDVAEHHWAGRTDRAFVLRSLLDAGATLALGSDAPVAPLDPWIGIAAAVSRARGARAPWHPEQSITRGEAIAASARGRRAVMVGDQADLAVLDADPWTVELAQLRGMPVVATLIGGRFTHDAL